VSAPVLIVSIAFAGAGLGLSNAAVQAAGIEALDPGDAGIAAGIFSTGRYMGGIAAASLVAALASGVGGRYSLLFGIEAVAALLSMLLALALPRTAITSPNYGSTTDATARRRSYGRLVRPTQRRSR
jgi:MFS family permease